MKKIIAIFITILILLGSLSACANETNTNNVSDAKEDVSKKISIVTTIFPIYDWVREILGNQVENVELTMLIDSGVDVHSYQLSTDDIVKISSCDMFIYVGGESEAWVEEILGKITNEKMVVIRLLESMGDSAKEEEMVEGMEVDHEHNHAKDEGHADHVEDEVHEDHEEDEIHEGHAEGESHEAQEEHGEHSVYDEHIWLSLKNAKMLCEDIVKKLVLLDSKNQELYTTNADVYMEKLTELDAEYKNMIDKSQENTILFGDRFPFRYLVDDYGLNYFAAFVGCSAETEASFETIAFLASKLDELGLSHVLTIEGAEHKIAETIIDNTKTKNQQILVMDSLQATTLNDAKNGKTYISIMKDNLDVLKEALR